jgi:iron complex outermembrane receptor protein
MRLHLLAGASALALCLASPAMAAEADAAATTSDGIEEIVVMGRGETRQVQTIQAVDILAAAPGTSPIKILSKLPGVNFQSADAFGAYEWAVRISVRGFNQNQLGFTLDDIPLGDMSYGNHNGMHVSRALINEMIGKTELSQGSGTLETASSNNLGGTVKFFSANPSDKFGGAAAVTGGSASMARAFVRIDSGETVTGGKGYLAYVNQQSDKWKGYGRQLQQQLNFKYVQPVGPVNLTALVNLSDRAENDYQDVTEDSVKRLGYNVDNISNNWTLAKQIAVAYQTGQTLPAPYKTVDDVYFDASGLRKDALVALKGDWEITKGLTAKATYYRHTNKGMGTWYTPYVKTPAANGGAPISERTTEYNIDRSGLVANLTYELGSHTIEGGIWVEDNDFHQARRYYGLGLDNPGRDSLKFQSNPFRTDWEYFFNTKTTNLHLQDTWKVTDALKVNYGFKTVKVENNANRVAGSNAVGSIEIDEGFLPQIGFNYDLADKGEIFGDYTQNARAFVSAGTAGPFSTSQAGFEAIKNKLRPEISKTFELGYRYRNSGFEGSVAIYSVKFEDRILSRPTGPGIVGNPSVLANVGGVSSKGIEAIGTYRFMEHWTAFGSFAYNRSEYDDDIFGPDGKVTDRIKGKVTQDTPETIAHAELAYDNDQWFARAGVSYTSRRSYTIAATDFLDGYTVAELSGGYRFQSQNPFLKGLEIQANITNLTDEQYFSTANSGGGGYHMVGAPRQAYLTVRKAF